MRIKLRLFDIKDIDELIFRLSGIGIGVGDLYRQLEEGEKRQLELFIDEKELHRLKPTIADLCQFEIIYTTETSKSIPLFILSILWMDNTLLYLLLKLSFLSQDFSYFLSYIIGSSKPVEAFKSLISLLAILAYYSGFILVQGATPVGRLFNLRIEKDQVYFVALFSMPLIAFKLLQFDQKLVKLLGLLILSLCLVLPFYFKSSVKYS